jgi:hypothetical protein
LGFLVIEISSSHYGQLALFASTGSREDLQEKGKVSLQTGKKPGQMIDRFPRRPPGKGEGFATNRQETRPNDLAILIFGFYSIQLHHNPDKNELLD